MKKIRICTVVTGQTLKEFLNNLAKIQKVSDFVELRIDYIQDLKFSDLEIIRAKTWRESIFTCRSAKEGGQFEASEYSRQQILQRANDLKFDYIDIELSATGKMKLESKNIKIILSFHDFKKTPSLVMLQKIAVRMRRARADILKFATMINSQNDISNLFRLLLQKKSKERMIVLGMGHRGKITRIVSPLLGGWLTFAATPIGQSAPGQINLEKLKLIYRELGYAG